MLIYKGKKSDKDIENNNKLSKERQTPVLVMESFRGRSNSIQSEVTDPVSVWWKGAQTDQSNCAQNYRLLAS